MQIRLGDDILAVVARNIQIIGYMLQQKEVKKPVRRQKPQRLAA
jgi:hypothetical protein